MRHAVRVLIVVAALALNGRDAAAQAKYQFNPGNFPGIGVLGWFIYDRPTSTLFDYSISFNDGVHPYTTFLFPATTLFSASPSGFTFTDETTSSDATQSYDVTIGSFQAWFERQPHPPASVTFADATATSGGTFFAPIYYNSTGPTSSGIQNEIWDFSYAGPADVQVTPEPGTLSLLALGLGACGVAARRRARNRETKA